jgi:uncharacterized Ntn-hydrolase superfamily protein
MTYSIIARDPITGDLGVALQSHWFNVGKQTIFGIAGVGVAATQSFVEPKYGELGLEKMAKGISPQEALSELLETDHNRETRQVALLSKTGEIAVYTGSKCIYYAGHIFSENVCCQANLMVNSGVPEAMLDCYLSSSGSLEERLLCALEAGQNAGGDLLGKQSAAILVVKGERVPVLAHGVKLDLRVEDSQEPLQELGRLLKLQKAYDLLNQSNDMFVSGNLQMANILYTELRRLEPDREELIFWAKAAPLKDRSCLSSKWQELEERLKGPELEEKLKLR